MPHSQDAQVMSFSNGIYSYLVQQIPQAKFLGVLGALKFLPGEDYVFIVEIP